MYNNGRGNTHRCKGGMDMRVVKTADAGEPAAVSPEDLLLINALARRELTAEEVYTFGVKLCDNEVDRDWERFPEATLEQLAELFVGKAGLFDHQWSARGQTARIYRTELVREDGILTRAGDPYCYLKGWAYMPRTEGNRELIEQIESGILKEVSVGCAVERRECSICGGELDQCGHERGREYGGKLCYGELLNATDAFEWSFVAVPAQKNAGVMKSVRLDSQKKLEEEAALGRRYLASLRREVARLGGLAECGLDAPALERIARKLDEPELLEMKRAYEDRVRGKWPVEVQLSYGEEKAGTGQEDGAFLI